MIYEFMRLVLFFDLPMKTKKEVKIYTHFRKYLIKNGYMMMHTLPHHYVNHIHVLFLATVK